jgi:hypothetical protein
VWSQIKQQVTESNKTFTVVAVEKLMNEGLDRVTQEDWASFISHTENLQGGKFAEDIGQEQILLPGHINLQDSGTEARRVMKMTVMMMMI